MSVTAAEYQEILDGEDWSPMMREALKQQQARADKRDRMLAKVSEDARRDGRTANRQREALRKLRTLHGLQFELTAWKESREAPLWIAEAESKAHREVRGMEERLCRARKEAEAGDALQVRWLSDHAALIAAVERWKL